jgi:hypothetical protein
LTTDGLLAFVGGTLVKELLAMIGLLAFVGSTLVEELLAMSCLLLFASSLLVNMVLAGRRLEAVALVLPQGIDLPLPILVGTFCAGASPKKDGPPGWVRRQYPSSLFVFSKGSLMPFFVTKGTTNMGWGIEFLIILEHPVKGAWGRLQPLVLQPCQRIREGGRRQMSRQ